MSLIDTVKLAAELVAFPITFPIYVVKSAREHKEQMRERERRMAMPPCYDDGVSKSEFEAIARFAVSKLPRTQSMEVDGLVIRICVNSKTGLTEWNASADFNDYGHLTGWYEVVSENDDSPIPDALAREVKAAIEECKALHGMA